LPLEAVTSPLESGDVEVRFEGVGPGTAATQRLPARRNRRGLSYVRAMVGNEEVRRVSIHPAAHPALIRVDWIALTIALDGEPEPLRVEFTTQEAIASVGVASAEWAAPRVLEARGRRSALLLDVESISGGGAVHQVELEFAFASLPVDDDLAALTRRRRRRSNLKRVISTVEYRTGLPVARILERVLARLRGLVG
jgi:hypothetical protein